MNFDKPKHRSLAGNTKKEPSRQELLEKARRERAARGAARQHVKAAVTIQAAYRALQSRRELQQALLQSWLQEYGQAVVQTTVMLPSRKIADEVLPPLLLVYLPQAKQHRSRRHAAIAGKDTAPLRGGISLLLRSVANPEAGSNYCSLGLDASTRAAWLHQAMRLTLLCSALVGTKIPGPEAAAALLEAAAGRLLTVLLQPENWKCVRPQGCESAQAAAKDLQAAVSGSAALPAAVRRVACRQASVQESGAAPAAQGRQQQQQADGVMKTILASALLPLKSLGAASVSRQLESSADAASQAQQVAWHVMTAPRLVEASPAAAALLQEPAVLQLLLQQLAQLAAESYAGSPAPGGAAQMQQATHEQLAAATLRHSGTATPAAAAAAALQRQQAAPPLQQADWLWAIANVAQLFAGRRVSRAVQGGKHLEFLEQSALLADADLAAQLVHTLCALLPACLTAQGSANLQEPLQGMWPLLEGTFISQQLHTSVTHTNAAARSAAGVQMSIAGVAAFWHLLLESLGRLEAGARDKAGSAAGRLVSALAFGCNMLPQLWRWLAMDLGLPVEAPKEATRGWDIASLQKGVPGLHAQHAALLGLFSRTYCHLLMVLDDEDFYNLQSTFTVSQQRGIATALNTLVFRTHCPATSGLPRSARSTGSGSLASPHSPQVALQPPSTPPPSLQLPPGVRPSAMLANWAPLLLRALYEREVRRSFCPRALWLAPYSATFRPEAGGPSGGDAFSAAAVVRALTAGAMTEQRGWPEARPVLMGGRPAALAALLAEAPQCVPFEERVLVFRALVSADQEQGRWKVPPAEGGPVPMQLTIRRTHILEDGYQALLRAGSNVKARLVVTFVNQQGMTEAGLDYGGLVLEFIEQVVQLGFDQNYGLYTSTGDGLAYPNPAARSLPGGLALLELVGLIVGKALYEGLLLDVPLAPFFVAHLQGQRPLFDDLATLDQEVHHSLLQLKRYEGSAADLCLDFTVEDDTFGSRTLQELRPGGEDLAVTDDNKLQYIHLVADWHLNGRLGACSAAFARGLHAVIPASWLRLFDPREVNQLVGGGASGDIDVTDLQQHSAYSNGYSSSDHTIRLFWTVLSEFGRPELQALVRFTTSCSRAPLGGFKHLNPPFTIHKVPCDSAATALLFGKDVDRLPSASTCFNMLKLPNYRRASTMRQKLLQSISSGAGFELS